MNFMQLIVGLTVGVLLMVGLVSPVVVDGQTTAGDNIIKTNESTEYISLSEGDCMFEYNAGVATINGTAYTLTANEKLVFATDYVVIYYNGTNAYGSYLNQTSGIRNIISATLTITDGLLNGSITYESVSLPQVAEDIPVEFSFYYDPEGDYSAFDPRNITPYVSSIKDLYMVGTYYTGENDTYYWYYKGAAGGISEEYVYSVTTTLTPVNGTTDIYTASDILMHIDGNTAESFTPFNMIVKKEIAGHATAGANYALLGAIPIIAFIALIAFAAFAVRGRMKD